MRKFQDKIILVTGSSRGIGRSIALEFAKEGGTVIINYNSSEQEAAKVATEIETYGGKAMIVKCDVSVESEVIQMKNTIVEKLGKIDILVNNAGIAFDSPILQKKIKDWDRTLDVNLKGYFICIKTFAPLMLKNVYGKIVNITSTSALYDFSPDIVDYDVSKAGIIALTKNFAKALAPIIQVNSIAPGWVRTDMHKGIPKNIIDSELANIYLKRMADPVEIAKVVLFLSSKDSSYITGSTLTVDGGHD